MNDNNVKLSMKGVKVGGLNIDDICIEAKSVDIINTIKSVIDELINHNQESVEDAIKSMDNRAIILSGDPLRESKVEIYNKTRSYTDVQVMRFMGNYFRGYKLKIMTVYPWNVTESVMRLLSQMQYSISSYVNDNKIESITITRNGRALFIGKESCFIVSIKNNEEVVDRTTDYAQYTTEFDTTSKNENLALKVEF